MENTEKKSYKSKLIQIICEDVIKDFLFTEGNGLAEKLQEALNDNLKFKTSVSEIESKNNQHNGKILFNDGDQTRLIFFSITSSFLTTN